MFKRKTSVTPSGGASRKSASPSVIAADMHVLGNIVSDGVLDIDGQITGNVRCHTVSIRPNGRIIGDVTAQVVVVHGQVEGLIKASAVTLYATAHVIGTIMHESLTIEDGAFVDGKFKRTDKVFMDDDEARTPRRLESPVMDTSFESDTDADGEAGAQSEAEIKILRNLRLIS